MINKGNDLMCGVDSPLNALCGQATSRSNRYIPLVVIALLMQYGLPIVVLFVMIPFAIGNLIAMTIIGMLASFNPIAIWLMIGLLAVDAVIMLVLAVVGVIITIVYLIFYFREIGWLTLIPLGAWVVSFVISFIPYFGGILSAMISLFPWMALAVIVHWWSNNGNMELNVNFLK
jgi:hypothetical protein